MGDTMRIIQGLTHASKVYSKIISSNNNNYFYFLFSPWPLISALRLMSSAKVRSPRVPVFFNFPATLLDETCILVQVRSAAYSMSFFLELINRFYRIFENDKIIFLFHHQHQVSLCATKQHFKRARQENACEHEPFIKNFQLSSHSLIKFLFIENKK
ncbi:MAG: hypothetical protein WCO97_09165 [bacterium]